MSTIMTIYVLTGIPSLDKSDNFLKTRPVVSICYT